MGLVSVVRVSSFTAAIAMLVFLVSFCSRRPPSLDRHQFEPLYKEAKTVEAALGTGISYVDLLATTRSFAAELLIARDRAETSPELSMLSAYDKALGALQDSSTIWKHKLEHANFGRVNAVYCRPILEKYRIANRERHLQLGGRVRR